MAKQSSTIDKGVAQLEYRSRDVDQQTFSLNTPFEDLKGVLLKTKELRLCSAKIEEIYEEHSVDTQFLRSHIGKFSEPANFDKEIITANLAPSKRRKYLRSAHYCYVCGPSGFVDSRCEITKNIVNAGNSSRQFIPFQIALEKHSGHSDHPTVESAMPSILAPADKSSSH